MALSLKNELKRRSRLNKKLYKQAKAEERQVAQRQREAVATNRQIQRQIGNNKFGRALMGAVYGFNTNMAPLSYSKKAADLGYKAYTPSAAATEAGDTTKQTAAWNKQLESSGAYKFGHGAGNMAATALSFIMGGAGTKALAGKALKTGALKKATGKVSESWIRKVAADKTGKTLSKRLLKRISANTTGKVTESAIENAARKTVNKVAENVTQDVIGDSTIGLYRDLASARANGVDVRDPKQLAPYLAQQAMYNTVIGGVTNAGGPLIKGIGNSKQFWRTVERVGADGKVHKVKELIPQRVVSARTAAGTASDISSPSLRNAGRQQRFTRSIEETLDDGTVRTTPRTVTPKNLKTSTVAEAMNNGEYIASIRRNGINGKSVRQVAEEQHRSISDVIADDYASTHKAAIGYLRRFNQQKLVKARQGVSSELSSVDVGSNYGQVNRAVSRPMSGAYMKSAPDAPVYVRNANDRRVLHNYTGQELVDANNARVAGDGFNNAAEFGADQAAPIKYRDDYIPRHNVDDLEHVKQLSDDAAEDYIISKYNMSALDYAQQNNLQRSTVLRMAKDEIADELGLPVLSDAERDAMAKSMRPAASESAESVTKTKPAVETPKAKKPAKAETEQPKPKVKKETTTATETTEPAEIKQEAPAPEKTTAPEKNTATAETPAPAKETKESTKSKSTKSGKGKSTTKKTKGSNKSTKQTKNTSEKTDTKKTTTKETAETESPKKTKNTKPAETEAPEKTKKTTSTKSTKSKGTEKPKSKRKHKPKPGKPAKGVDVIAGQSLYKTQTNRVFGRYYGEKQLDKDLRILSGGHYRTKAAEKAVEAPTIEINGKPYGEKELRRDLQIVNGERYGSDIAPDDAGWKTYSTYQRIQAQDNVEQYEAAMQKRNYKNVATTGYDWNIRKNSDKKAARNRLEKGLAAAEAAENKPRYIKRSKWSDESGLNYLKQAEASQEAVKRARNLPDVEVDGKPYGWKEYSKDVTIINGGKVKSPTGAYVNPTDEMVSDAKKRIAKYAMAQKKLGNSVTADAAESASKTTAKTATEAEAPTPKAKQTTDVTETAPQKQTKGEASTKAKTKPATDTASGKKTKGESSTTVKEEKTKTDTSKPTKADQAVATEAADTFRKSRPKTEKKIKELYPNIEEVYDADKNGQWVFFRSKTGELGVGDPRGDIGTARVGGEEVYNGRYFGKLTKENFEQAKKEFDDGNLKPFVSKAKKGMNEAPSTKAGASNAKETAETVEDNWPTIKIDDVTYGKSSYLRDLANLKSGGHERTWPYARQRIATYDEARKKLNGTSNTETTQVASEPAVKQTASTTEPEAPKKTVTETAPEPAKKVTETPAEEVKQPAPKKAVEETPAPVKKQVTKETKAPEPAPANETPQPKSTAKQSELDATMGGQRSGVKGKESQSVETIARQRGNTKEEIREIEKELRESDFGSRFHHSNKDLIEEATSEVQRRGLDETRAGLREVYDSNSRWDDVLDVKAQILQNRYTQIERLAREAGNEAAAKRAVEARDEVINILAAERSEAGKSLQAAQVFNKLSPEGRVNAILMMKRKIEVRTGAKNIDVDNNLLAMLHDAKSEADQTYLKEVIATKLWDQVPATLTEKLSAWRYMSMLLNPKTHVRNIVGNLFFKVPRGMANLLSAGLQKAVTKGTKTKAILNPLSKTDNLLKNKGFHDWSLVKRKFYGETTKFSENMFRPEDSRVFKNNFLEWLSKTNGKFLNAEDEYFAKRAYADAYAQYLKANKINLETASEEALDAARKHAWDEALIATYREDNALASLINQVRKGANISLRDIKNAKGSQTFKLIGEKAAGTVVDTMIPFVKTPANILKEGVYYSPAGLVRTAYHIVNAEDPQHVIKAIDSFSQAASGSALFGLGFWLAHKGMAKSSMSFGKDDDQDFYDYDRGVQEYSITIGNNSLKKYDWFDLLNSSRGNDVNVTVDSLAPSAMAFFTGVETYNALLGENGNEDDISDKATRAGRMFANIPRLADPIFGMSMLSSLREALDKSKDDGASGFSPYISSAIQSRLGQYVPTVLSQATKTFDKGQRSQDSVKVGSAKSWDQWLKQQQNKVPYLASKNPLKRDVYGNIKEEKKSTKNYVQSFLKTAVSPFNIKQIRNDSVDKEIQKRVSAGAATDEVLPDRKGASQITKSFEGFDFKIGAKELTKYNEIRGKHIHSDLETLFKSDDYKSASNTGKVDLIKSVYSNATKKADRDFAISQGVDEYDYDYKSMNDTERETYDKRLRELKEAGSSINKKKYMQIFRKLGDFYGRPEHKHDGYVFRTMAAIEAGVRQYRDAVIITNANSTTWDKVKKLYDKKISAEQIYKYAITEDEYDKCCTKKVKNYKTTRSLDQRKLTLYINAMKIPREEKWARFEVNRLKYWSNPF